MVDLVDSLVVVVVVLYVVVADSEVKVSVQTSLRL
jgi:hypothetical protein